MLLDQRPSLMWYYPTMRLPLRAIFLSYLSCYLILLSQQNEAAARLVKAFKADHYKITTLHADGIQEVHQSYRDTLSSLLYTKLGKLDKKYHIDLPAIIKSWTYEHELLENGWQENAQNEDSTKDHDMVAPETLEKAKADYDAKELEYLKQSWMEWLKSAQDKDGERVVSAEERRNRLKSTVRERLSALETAE